MRVKLNEAVGVPKGIVVAGEKLYDDFKRKVIPMLKDVRRNIKLILNLMNHTLLVTKKLIMLKQI